MYFFCHLPITNKSLPAIEQKLDCKQSIVSNFNIFPSVAYEQLHTASYQLMGHINRSVENHGQPDFPDIVRM